MFKTGFMLTYKVWEKNFFMEIQGKTVYVMKIQGKTVFVGKTQLDKLFFLSREFWDNPCFLVWNSQLQKSIGTLLIVNHVAGEGKSG